MARLSPPQLVAQLIQNGADIYGKDFQLPRYIVTQECLAGFDGGNIFLAPPVNQTPSSGFLQPVNMGNSWDVELVREVASAISDEARAAFNHAARPSLTCMSPNLNVNRDPRETAPLASCWHSSVAPAAALLPLTPALLSLPLI